MIKIKIPATTANMGPGFDTIGMALTLYNEVEIEENNGGIEIISDKIFDIPLADNLIYTSMIKTLDMYGYKYKGFNIKVTGCKIPVSRGLGSSAACIVGGIAAANKLLNFKLTIDEIISLATEIEGHPDNVAAAALGGMVVSLKDKQKVIYSKINIPKSLKFAVMVPDFKVSTNEARKVVPKVYSREDCVFNVSRAAMLVAAFSSGDADKIRVATHDAMHQPYRKHLIKNIDEIFEKCNNLGSKGEFISGSGSTLISVIESCNENFGNNMEEFLQGLEGGWRILLLDPDYNCVKVS